MVASNDLVALLIDKGEGDPKLLLSYLSLPDIPHEMRYNQVVAWLLENTNPDCRFDLIGVAGTGLGWGESNTSWLGEGRLQFRWNVSRVISLYTEPSMTIWGDKLYEDNTYNFVGVGRLSAGLAVRF